jgi:hypothetical protein
MADINVTNEIIDVNVTEEVITVAVNSGAYPIPNPVNSVFGRIGNIVAAEGDYSLTQLSDVTLTSSLNNQVLRYNGTSWINSTITDFVPYTDATSDLNLGINNIYANNLFEKFVSITASGTQLVLTLASAPSMVVTGSGGQTIKLPDATTLPNGATYYFNNNQSSGVVNVNNNSNTLVKAAQSGAYLVLTLTDNSIAAGSWDAHFEVPSNVSWSTNTFDYVGSITGATWNGVAVAINRGGTGATTSAAALTNLGGIGLTSLSATTPLSYNNTTGVFTISQATASANGFLASGDFNTFNNKQNALTNPVTGTGTTNTLPKFTGTSAIGNSNITDTGTLITLGSNTRLNGSLWLNTTQTNMGFANYVNMTGSTSVYGQMNAGIIQSDATVNGFYYDTFSQTAAASFTLGNLVYYRAYQGTFGAGSTVTLQTGFEVNNTLIGATTNYGFRGRIPSGTNRFNLYMDGTADNFLAGSLGIGTTSLTGYSLRISKNIAGSTTAYVVRQEGTVQSDVTSDVIGFRNDLNTAASAFTLTNYWHFWARQGSIGSTSAVTNQYGYYVDANMVGATNNYGFRGAIPSGSNRWNLYMDGTANNYMAGSLGIGTTSLTGYNLRVANNITGATTAYAISAEGVIQSDVTNTGIIYGAIGSTQAAAFTLGTLYYYSATQGTFGSTSAVTTQIGFRVSSSLTGATNNYGFRGQLASAANVWNLYMDGTANNYLAGSLGIGTISLTQTNLSINKNLTGSTTMYGVLNIGQIQSDVTVATSYFSTYATSANAVFTMTSLGHYVADTGGFGASSTISNQYGFWAKSTMIGATNNFGFYGGLAAAANTWNLYMNGTANNYIAGSLGIGTTSLTGKSLSVSKIITGQYIFSGGSYGAGIISDGQIQSDEVGGTSYYVSKSSTAASTFTSALIAHYDATQGTFGSGSTVTSQIGFYAESTLTGATSNFGFYGNLAAASNVWNLYMNGTANNYMAGSLGIGATGLGGYTLRASKNITGAVASYGIVSDGATQSDVTTSVDYFRSSASTQAAAFTLFSLTHFNVNQGTIGSTSAVTNQYGFAVGSSLTGATNNYGFYGNIASGSNRWNLYMAGTAANYMAGSLNIGTTSVLTDYPLNAQGTVNGNLLFRFANTSNGTSARMGLILGTDFGALGSIDAYGTAYNVGSTDDIANGIRLLGSGAGGLSLRASNASGTIRIYTGSTERVRVKSQGQMRFVPLASDPSGAEAGDVYYNSTTNKLKVYNGTAWETITSI